MNCLFGIPRFLGKFAPAVKARTTWPIHLDVDVSMAGEAARQLFIVL